MTNYILIYLLCGAIFGIFFDLLITGLEKSNGEDMSHLRFTHLEKFLNLIVWPYNFILFIVGLIVNEDDVDTGED
jgi:hypothetical protein